LFLPFFLVAPALAAVDLVTLPTREGTQLTIYNSEDITMVREHRLLTVKLRRIRAIVVPDNVLFEGGAGETVRNNLLKQFDVRLRERGMGF
ncbi:MAG: hypothetical protein WCJ35_23120, partial [Planctomycetota bacterium]